MAGAQSIGGYCAACHREHSLERTRAAEQAASALMGRLGTHASIAIGDVGPQPDDSRLSVEPLYRDCGQMFGVAVCIDACGKTQVLRAFSGSFNGESHVWGWAPPIHPARFSAGKRTPAEDKLTALGAQIAARDADVQRTQTRLDDIEQTRRAKSAWVAALAPIVAHHAKLRAELEALRHERRNLSRRLTRERHAGYYLTNFRRATRPLTGVYAGPGGIPTGTGDCCAPKLLQLAARQGLQPLSLAEFWWGASPTGTRRTHRQFYPPCSDKCVPILGFMLCGSETAPARV